MADDGAKRRMVKVGLQMLPEQRAWLFIRAVRQRTTASKLVQAMIDRERAAQPTPDEPDEGQVMG